MYSFIYARDLLQKARRTPEAAVLTLVFNCCTIIGGYLQLGLGLTC